jgi:hypothetical protein
VCARHTGWVGGLVEVAEAGGGSQGVSGAVMRMVGFGVKC